MTRLRDDGYLEIGIEPRDKSDIVMASCFTGRDDYANYSIYAVGDFGWIEGELYTERNYPILIPAKTVAEVVDTGVEFSNLVLGSIGMYEQPTYTLNDWLRAHTEEKS